MSIKKASIKISILLTFILLVSSLANADGLDLGVETFSEPAVNDNDGTFTDDSGPVANDNDDNINTNSGDLNSEPSVSSDSYLSTNNDVLIPQACIVSEFTNSININSIINIEGWVKNPRDEEVEFQWYFGDGDVYSGYGIGQPFSCDTTHIYTEVGSYKITLYLIDKDSTLTDDSILAEDSIQIIVEDVQLDIDTGGPYSGLVGKRIWFKAGLLSNLGAIGNIISYGWNFGDGYTAEGLRVSHKYDNPGIYEASLTAMDDMGNIATATTIVTIAEITITIHPNNPVVGEQINFGVEVIGFTPTKYSWKFEDGSRGSGQSVTHIYTESRTYYGSISIDDDISSSFAISVDEGSEIDNNKPVSHFLASSYSGDTSTLFEFDASTSYDQDGKIVLYEWYFGDGKMIITRNPKCVYAFDNPGNWKVKCITIDNDGDFGSSYRTIEVSSGEQSSSASLLSDQDGLIVFKGVLGNARTTVKSNEESIIETRQLCNLDISVNMDSKSSESEESIIIEVVVSDLSGKYNAESVDIQLISNIPGYETVNFDAKFYQNLGGYYSSMDIHYSSSDVESYAINIAAMPLEGYSDTDLSGNRWSIVELEELNNLSEDESLRDITSGSVAL